MISKAQIKDIKALHSSKFRQIYNKFIAEGDKVCIEFLKKRKYSIEQIFITQGNEHLYEELLHHDKEILTIVSNREMEQISALKTASNIFLLLEKTEDPLNVLLNNSLDSIYLDGVQDPGNCGTIIRIADWFGISAVIRSADSADFFNPKVVQSTMGSMVNVALYTAELSEIVSQSIEVYGSYMEGSPLIDIKINSNSILVMGSEGQGISLNNEKHIKHKISIPGSNGKIADSLNVGIATGIICNHWKNQ